MFSLSDACLSHASPDASFSFHAHLAPPLTSLSSQASRRSADCSWPVYGPSPPDNMCVSCVSFHWVCCVAADEKFLTMHLQHGNNTTPRPSSALILTGGVGGGEADVPARRQSAEVMRCFATSRQTVRLQPGLFIYSVKIM